MTAWLAQLTRSRACTTCWSSARSWRPAISMRSTRRRRAELDEAVEFAEASPEPERGRAGRRGLCAAHRARGARRARRPRADLRASAERGDGAGDGARPARVPDGRGRGRIPAASSQVSKGLLDRSGASGCAIRRSPRRPSAARAVGAAIAGMRPIVEVQIFDFVTLMMDMIVNQAAKFRYMLGGHADRAAGDPRAAGRRHPPGRAALAEPGGLVRARAGPGGGRALVAVRRQGPADRGDPRRQPGHLPRAQAALSRPGRAGARAALCDPARQGRDQARRAATSRWSRPRRWCSRRCSPRPGSRARASASR